MPHPHALSRPRTHSCKLLVEADMPKENAGNPDHEVSLRTQASTEATRNRLLEDGMKWVDKLT